MPTIQKITPCLWFDDQAEAAAQYYTSIFPNSRITTVAHYSEVGHEIHQRPAGSVMIVGFELDGVAFTALNGGPHFKFTEAISLQVNCEDQQELDYFWESLGAGGDPAARQCGWLKDKYGLSWQIVPAIMAQLVNDATPDKSGRVMAALLQMTKLDIAALLKAYE